MIKPGLLIPVWHNSGDHRLSPSCDVYQRIGFGMWRKLRTIDGDEAVSKGFGSTPLWATVRLFYRSYGWAYNATDGFRCGLLFRWSSLWVGAHYSPYNRRWCINLVPCVTLWITLKGGRVPSKEH